MSLYSGAVKLSGGKYSLDLADSMAKAMDDAFVDAYQKLKGQQLPDKDKDDRRMLFVAVARGMLNYLRDHENDMLSSMDLTAGGGPKTTFTVNAVAMNVVTDA